MTQNKERKPDDKLISAVQEHFLHIREPETMKSEQRESVDRFIEEYDGALLLDANYYRGCPELLLKVGRDGLLGNKRINHFQFQDDEDQFTTWGVAMKLEMFKDSSLWIPTTTTFARMLRTSINLLKERWIEDNSFAHPTIGSDTTPYDYSRLREYLLSYTTIKTNKSGQINHVRFQGKDEVSNTIQEVNLFRGGQPEALPVVSPITLQTLQFIFEQLPIDMIEEKRGGNNS